LAAPDLTFSEEFAGYDTLVAVAEELRPALPRPRMQTRGYGDRISNAPGSTSPRTARQLDAQPKLQITETSVGRDTFAAIEHELAPHLETPDISIGEETAGDETLAAIERELAPDDGPDVGSLEIHQVVTFIVRADARALAADAARRKLVERRLLSRLPVRSASEVAHVEVAPWTTRGTLLVRVWCRVLD
jgi:hypothetical protein